ncbi:hypothetical protein BH11PSE13_BH11PSE13_12550 [soil metagenome]
MSRSGYTDDYNDEGTGGLWRGAVAAAIKGKRGQALLIEMKAAFEAMPVKELVDNEMEAEGSFCSLGVVGHQRGMNMSMMHPEIGRHFVAKSFGIADAMAAEIMFENDEGYHVPWNSALPREETPAHRWSRMHAWVTAQIKKPGTEEKNNGL